MNIKDNLAIYNTKEYYEEFKKSFLELVKTRKSINRKHHPIDDFDENSDYAYSEVKSVIDKTSTLTKSHRDILLILHSTTIIKINSKIENGSNTEQLQD